MTSLFLERLHHPSRPVLVFDGAMGTNLQSQNLTAEDFGGADYEGCNEYLVVTKPTAVAQVHRDFLSAGADIIETDTFGANAIVLAEYDLAPLAYELNVKAAQLAKQLTQEFSTPEKPRFVAGSIGPGTKLPTLGHIDFDSLVTSYQEQVQGLLAGGVDLLLLETCQDVLQIKAGLQAISQVFDAQKQRVPVMVSVTMEQQGTMLVGSDIGAIVAILEPYAIDIIGLNCATGPDLMEPHIRYLSQHAPFVISCIPNAGLPENVNGQAVYRLEPPDLAGALRHFVGDLGVQIIGGCCGTRPAHIRQLVQLSQELKPKQRQVHYVPSAASIYSAQPYQQDNSFLIIGERLNASGSKKCRDLLNLENWDGLVAMGKEQVREGAHILDVNVDYVGRNGEEDMKALVSRLVTQVSLPLMLDSTEWTKMEAGLKVAGGKCILNSTNYEDGEPRFLQVLKLAKTYGTGVVIGTIDEEGMARTAEKKFTIAQRAYRQAVEFGIPARELFFDPLALPISTGIEEDRRNAMATIESIAKIKSNLPECHIVLGVSNVSFGLKSAARIALNSVFLSMAQAAGMDAAIVSANKILPMHKISPEVQNICRQLINDERQFAGNICVYDPLGKLTDYFSDVTVTKTAIDPETLTLEERLRRHIIDGERIGLEPTLQRALECYAPLDIINNHLLEGMKTVGELFGSGQMQLPFVLQSAETMKAAVAFLEPLMEKQSAAGKGTVIIATVKGDVHDIGKNLVDIILSNNGYRVINLGIKQEVTRIIDAYQQYQPDCIAMSGLLVKSTAFMKENLEIFNQKQIAVPVILGGAALTRKFVEQDCQQVYQGRVIYGKDAFSDLHFMDQLMAAKSQGQWDDQKGFLDELNSLQSTELPDNNHPITKPIDSISVDEVIPPQVTQDVARPLPPFWGNCLLVATQIPLDEVWGYLDQQALIAGQWQFRKPREQTKEEYQAFLTEKVYPILTHWREQIEHESCLEPQLVYGYFPCQSEGNALHIYDPEYAQQFIGQPVPFQTDLQPIASFQFPRQRTGKRLCIADFFAPVGSSYLDVIALQAVTMGQLATEYAQKLYDGNAYSDYLYFHGIAVQMAEALAEWNHARIRRELGYQDQEPDNIHDILAQRYPGSRYSFGYPACPNLQDQYALLELLATQRINLVMDDAEQLHPEQSTTALICYHPEARYFTP
ncbi:methionine synthase [Gloeomargarita lithophora Alchichica-D10]|uniref:Methionine synthase n=1 Tax=Gloeomargarita lithophora Alchichica-D10 TaxID=1188229 RepID=A0A1J0AAA1_9CYAN|nr:methionine synthase [Gloeomargarita lithophora]APB32855.1 methionine synthase [Gloeomargarita lithophora Alchichica-D10]